MLRGRLAILPVLLAAAPAAMAAPAASGTAPGGPVVKVAACSIPTHSAAFKARMGWLDGTDHMALRFRLLEKGTGGFHAVKAAGLGRWHQSKPAVGMFGYRQGVRNLRAGAAYRAEVDFRWFDADGQLLLSARRRSPTCRQFESLPNLVPTLMGSTPGAKPGVVRYKVRVANLGVAPAIAIPVRLTVDGSVVNTVTIASLAPRERRWLTLAGPQCEGTIAVAADPDGLIAEASEIDNSATVACEP